MSNAERQRRYRDRVARNAHALLESVTRTCNAPTVTESPASVTRVTPENVTCHTPDVTEDVTKSEHIQPVAVGDGVLMPMGPASLADY